MVQERCVPDASIAPFPSVATMICRRSSEWVGLVLFGEFLGR
jgi:hypothetical protein